MHSLFGGNELLIFWNISNEMLHFNFLYFCKYITNKYFLIYYLFIIHFHEHFTIYLLNGIKTPFPISVHFEIHSKRMGKHIFSDTDYYATFLYYNFKTEWNVLNVHRNLQLLKSLHNVPHYNIWCRCSTQLQSCLPWNENDWFASKSLVNICSKYKFSHPAIIPFGYFI